MVMYLLVVTASYFNILFCLQYVFHSTHSCSRKPQSELYVVCSLWLDFLKKDSAMNIEIELNAVDCRN